MDAYVYDFCRENLIAKIKRLIGTFNECADTYAKSQESENIFDSITGNQDISTIKWTDTLKTSLRRGKRLTFDESKIREVLYRPFTKCYLYEDWDILSAGKSAARLFPISDSNNTEQIYSGGGVHYSSGQPSNSHSVSARGRHSSISDSPADEEESSGQKHLDSRSIQPIGESNIRDNASSGLTHGQSDEVGLTKQSLTPPPPGISVTSPSNKTVFGIMGLRTVTDLCSAGTTQPSRLLVTRS